MISMNMTFPDNFRFGVADADLQVIGEDRTRAEEELSAYHVGSLRPSLG